jgi:hypothetical protein
MYLYKILRRGSVWAGNNKGIARMICIFISVFMLFYGLRAGYALFEEGYKVPEWMPSVIITVCFAVSVIFDSAKWKANGQRRAAKKRYFNKLTQYTVCLYSAFLVSVCVGNFAYNNDIYSSSDAWEDWSWYNTFNDRQITASVEYNNIPPPAERVQKKTGKKMKFRKRWSVKKFKLKSQKAVTKSNRVKGELIAVGILLILLALGFAVLSCMAFCTGTPWGISLCVLGIGSAFSCVALAVYSFIGFARSRHKKGRKRDRGRDRRRNAYPENKSLSFE